MDRRGRKEREGLVSYGMEVKGICTVSVLTVSYRREVRGIYTVSVLTVFVLC